MVRSTTIKKSNCNGVCIETEKQTFRGCVSWAVCICDQYDEWAEPEEFEYESEAEALVAHDQFVEEYKDKPNWNAQTSYDAEHGTINGQDARIVEWNELVGEG